MFGQNIARYWLCGADIIAVGVGGGACSSRLSYINTMQLDLICFLLSQRQSLFI